MSQPSAPGRVRRFFDPYRIVLFALIAGYVTLFTRLAWQLHAGMRTHKADLGQIDQAIWNSSRGRFVEMTDNGYIATRMTDHVEPILALISPIYWVWDDVRAALLLQAIFVGIGAWLLYELTLTLFTNILPPGQRTHIWRLEPIQQAARPLALALAVAWLLAPQLQSALLTEFHAAPLSVPLILWALWSVERRRWLQFAIAALLLAVVKEEMALLTAGLGAWAVWREARLAIGDWRLKTRRNDNLTIHHSSFTIHHYPGLLTGAIITILTLAWFIIATFIIVPAHAAEVYGIAESGYFQRYGALGDSPADIFKSFFTQPGLVWAIATEPVRLRYFINLLMPFGFLTLLAPELLLIALPVLLANQLSAYPAQYYGEFHYSAPLMPYMAAGAALGVTRLWRFMAKRTDRSSASFQHMPAAGAGTMAAASLYHNSRTAIRPLINMGLVVWILAWALFSYAQHGRGPLGARHDPTPISAHHQLLERFTAQIPADAAVTATAAVHPHVSHRRYVYQFPTGLEAKDGELGNAEWALIDVTTNTDMAPGDVKWRVDQMLAGEWGVVDGADGFLLLQKGATDKTIPDAFYHFARVKTSAEIAGDAPLTFAGLEVDDWLRWRQTKLSGIWQVGDGFDPRQTPPTLQVRTPAGETLFISDEITPPALLWYPPERWQPGDMIRITTLLLYLPQKWGAVASHTAGYTARTETPSIGDSNREDAALVATYQRTGRDQLIEQPLSLLVANDYSVSAQAWTGSDVTGAAATLQFEPGRTLQLQAWLADRASWPGDLIDVWLQWGGAEGEPAAGWPEGMTTFVHLRRADGNVDQNDGLPRLFVAYELDRVMSEEGFANDWRQLRVPANMPADDGIWQVVVGLYDPQTGQRAEVLDANGQPIANELIIGEVTIGDAPLPDQSCALVPETCTSQGD